MMAQRFGFIPYRHSIGHFVEQSVKLSDDPKSFLQWLTCPLQGHFFVNKLLDECKTKIPWGGEDHGEEKTMATSDVYSADVET